MFLLSLSLNRIKWKLSKGFIETMSRFKVGSILLKINERDFCWWGGEEVSWGKFFCKIVVSISFLIVSLILQLRELIFIWLYCLSWVFNELFLFSSTFKSKTRKEIRINLFFVVSSLFHSIPPLLLFSSFFALPASDSSEKFKANMTLFPSWYRDGYVFWGLLIGSIVTGVEHPAYDISSPRFSGISESLVSLGSLISASLLDVLRLHWEPWFA